MRRFFVLFMLLLVSIAAWSETVYDIQYTTDPGGASPYEGQVVTVTGIVTATNWYSSGNANRFFMSDPEGGEWHGIFVFNYDYEVELGDEVEVTAEVVEYYGFTELSNLEALTILSSGNAVPDPITVTTAALAETEAYESVLVQVNDITVTADQDEYGQAYIDDGSGQCQTDDAMYDYEPVLGAEYGYMIGIVDYSYDEYGLNPRFAEDLGYNGLPGYIEGFVELDGGSGNVEDVVISAGGTTVNPDDSGEYEMELTPGTYDVTASLPGYSPQTISDVLVEEDETTSEIDFVLTPQEEVTIYDIQFTEDASGDSPYMDQTVTVSGIVTGAGFAGNNFFFISSPDGGAWNGLYVYQYDYEVEIGDEVTISGTISEYYGFTELGDVTEVTINSSGNTLPAPVEITTAELASSEAYESVLVKVSNVEVAVIPNEYGEWFVDDGSGQCQVDDGFGATYPDVAVGDQFVSITGLLDYSYDQYGLNPRDMDDFETGTAPEITSIYDIQFTEDASGDSPYLDMVVTVEGLVSGAGYNTDYYFITSPEGGAWNGLYVYDDTNAPAEGDEVRITGTIDEYFGFTELADITSFEILSNGNTLPVAEEITALELASSEAYESVLVMIINLTVTAIPNEYGEWYVEDESGQCQVDDGFGVVVDFLQVGDIIGSITGIVDYSYSEYGLNPRSDEDLAIIPANDENLISNHNLTAYPNPFNAGLRSTVKLGFDLQATEMVELAIYNIKGQKVRNLLNEELDYGHHEVIWNGCDRNGNLQPAGVYFYQITSSKTTQSGKLLMLR